MLRFALYCLPFGLLAPASALAYDEPPWPGGEPPGRWSEEQGPDPDEADQDAGGDHDAPVCPYLKQPFDGSEQAPEPEPGPAASRGKGSQLDALEAAVLDEMNTLRRDPRGYARKLAALRPSYQGNLIHRPGQASILTQEGVAALDEAIDALARAPRRLPRLAASEGLARAAADHARDLGRTGQLGHTGSDGSGPDTRVARHGKWDGLVAENIAFGPTDAEEIVIGLLVDDGVPDRGHRDVLLTRELFFAGVGCGPHPSYGTTCVIDYASSFRSTRLEADTSEPEAPAMPGPSIAPGDMLRDGDEGDADEEAGEDEFAPEPWRREPLPAPSELDEQAPGYRYDEAPGRTPEAPEVFDEGDEAPRYDGDDEDTEGEEGDELEQPDGELRDPPFIVRYYEGPPPHGSNGRGYRGPPPGPNGGYYRGPPPEARWRRPPPDARWRRPNPWRYR